MESKGKKFIVNKEKNVFDSFSRALDGFKSAYATEYHMVMHCYFAIAIIICGVLFNATVLFPNLFINCSFHINYKVNKKYKKPTNIEADIP